MSTKSSNAFHIGLHVKDITKTVDFYTNFLGIEAAKIKSDYAKFEVENPNLALTFNLAPSEVHPRFGHMGFRVASHDELNKTRSRVSNSGLAITDEEGTNCCYANQDKFWVNDPDGFQWEVYVLNEDVEVNDTRQESACCGEESVCC